MGGLGDGIIRLRVKGWGWRCWGLVLEGCRGFLVLEGV